MSPQAGPRLAAPSYSLSSKHISSLNLLVAGVKGPLYLHRERQMNPGLKQGTCFFPLPDAPPPVKGSFIVSLILNLKWEGAIRLEKLEKASPSGEKPQSLVCEKRRQ